MDVSGAVNGVKFVTGVLFFRDPDGVRASFSHDTKPYVPSPFRVIGFLGVFFAWPDGD